MQYILSVHPQHVRDHQQGLKIAAIKKHFEETHPGLYGGGTGKLKQYKIIVAQAIADGMLMSANGLVVERAKLSRITLIPGARYSL